MNTITVNKRDLTVKAKKLRHAGMIPASVFGGSLKEPIALQMEEATARRLIRNLREGSKLTLDIEGQMLPVQIKEKSINSLNNDILHLSFQALEMNQVVNSVIHIILKNTDKLTTPLEKMLMEIPYASLPEHMIDTITIDVDGMAAGSVITVGDIEELMSEKIELQVEPKEMVLRLI